MVSSMVWKRVETLLPAVGARGQYHLFGSARTAFLANMVAGSLMEPEEVLALRWTDVSWEMKAVRVDHRTGRGDGSVERVPNADPRWIILTKDQYELLRAARCGTMSLSSPLIFGDDQTIHSQQHYMDRFHQVAAEGGAPLEAGASLSGMYRKAKTVIMNTPSLIHPDDATGSRNVAPDSIFRAFERFNTFMHSLGVTDYQKSDTWRAPLYRQIISSQ